MATTIINSSTHSASSCYSQKGRGNSDDGSNARRQPLVIVGNLVSITVRKDTPKAKAGIKLIQDRNGQVTVKNIASNGLFGNTELEVGDIILSVNRKRLSDGEGPDLLMKWVHKYNTISISVRKPPPPSSLLPSPGPGDGSSSSSSSSPTIKTPKTSTKTTKNKKKSVATKKKDKSTTTTTTTTGKSNKNKIVTITAEKPESSSSTNNKSKDNNCGLVFEIQNKKIVVVDILPNSMFFESSSTTATPPEQQQQQQLNIGDCILTINDMCFRKYADIDYAYQIMNKSKIMVILVVEKQKEKKKTTVIKPKKVVTNSSKYEFEIESEFKIEKYRPITITVPKHFSSGHTESIGVEFQIIKTNKGDALNTVIEQEHDTTAPPPKTTSWVYVSKIDNDSLFENTPLKVGDKIISINDINLRNNDHNKMIDTGIRQAYKACLKAKEFITMTILKDDETIFLEKSFTFDNSSTNLDWRF
ncbi:hypothetical protein FRACYDRAFT_241015 [Fragilariopsis cylindrus CCMP1102]|uniref:PDZ domain-containing protein n=1 Tax=Fragilariopsis cylindrus CCMP1102 TaxID=635003 RepID=A0A1E7F8G5_9STRA|nr:hypothetical protein FRACYDRAFT_241015 [Fragilariopsis cylindrus CCMP1102]|eukprot:OEU14470.1 hypothetical protein FRACYDRAFT_241015 [Fragilariopsis cylindrus CCMP1102]